jgi:hypothetical protein
MSSSTSTATNNNGDIIIPDQTMKYVNLVLDDFREGGRGEDPLDKAIQFLLAAAANPEDATDAYLEYFADDPVKGREIISKLGVDATFGDLDAAMRNGTIQ